MRTRTTIWFETKVKYEKMMEDGQQKMVIEPYVVDALSFTEAESSILEEMSAYVSGEIAITGISKAAYGEVVFSDMEADDKFYKARLQFITIDEKTEKEKRSTVTYLIQAGSLMKAVNYIDEFMGSTMIDYAITSVAETKIMDVFEHNASVKREARNDVPEYEQAETETTEGEA